jgi:hypothetical protein
MRRSSSARGRLYPPPVRRRETDSRFAERVLRGVDDQGEEERVVLWIERKPGALWAVGRAVDPNLRQSDEPRPDDYLFEGYELDDALDAANGALEDEVRVLEEDGFDQGRVAPFKRSELLGPLERWFFGRR